MTMPPPASARQGGPSALKIVLLVVGGVALVFVLIIVVLVAMLVPSLSRAREVARETQVMSSIRSITMAAELYASEYDGAMPPHLAAIVPYLGDGRVLTDTRSGRSPTSLKLDDPRDWAKIVGEVDACSDFGYLGEGLRSRDVTSPGSAPMIYAKIATRKGERLIGFFDGHVDRVPASAVPRLLEGLNKARKDRDLPELPATLP